MHSPDSGAQSWECDYMRLQECKKCWEDDKILSDKMTSCLQRRKLPTWRIKVKCQNYTRGSKEEQSETMTRRSWHKSNRTSLRCFKGKLTTTQPLQLRAVGKLQSLGAEHLFPDCWYLVESIFLSVCEVFPKFLAATPLQSRMFPPPDSRQSELFPFQAYF